jgi:hypothetical protein
VVAETDMDCYVRDCCEYTQESKENGRHFFYKFLSPFAKPRKNFVKSVRKSAYPQEQLGSHCKDIHKIDIRELLKNVEKNQLSLKYDKDNDISLISS